MLRNAIIMAQDRGDLDFAMELMRVYMSIPLCEAVPRWEYDAPNGERWWLW